MDWEVRAASLILCLGILLATIQNGIAERRIVCYYTNWSVYRPGTAKFSPQNINPYLCTHLIYAFGGFTKDNALRPFDKYQDIEKGGYAKFTGLKTYNKNLKTILAIGGWNEGSSRFSPMVADSARRREFVKNTVKFLRQNHFDGLDLDWEYPAFRDGGKPRDKDNYANLVQELREEFERESSKTGRPRLLLSMAMPAGVEYIDKGYDVPRLNEYLDFINLLSYDYHSAYEPVVNHHSPLYPLEEDNEYNYDAELTIDYTINYLLEKGASADKIVLGIPTYGRSYTLFNQDATELGSPADGPGVEGEATREKGYLAYYEICESIAGPDEWEVVQPNAKAMGPYAFRGDQWVGYDDENIVKLKARYVNEKKLGGIMFWSIDNDDFRGKCHGRPYPLIEAAKEALLTDNSGNTIDKPKSVDSRKKTRTQNAQSNASKSNYRRSSTTTPTPIATKRASSSRPKYRNISRPKASDEDREESKKSYESSSDEDIEGGNTVRVTEKTERPKHRNRSKTRSGSTDRSSHRKQSKRKGQTRNDENEEQESLSNKLTTPEPPTTPDPGTDFKCEDEGFFPHPRDCKKYFWCLDSGPSGLGVVAHQFTCPSGLVFNKAADSCDYPRNVICPKTSKTSVVSTTKSPITAATSRTTYLHSTTTAKAESEEYDSEEDYGDESEEEEEEEEVREEPATTAKPLIYKTLTRNRPGATTTTTTTITTTSKSSEPERASDTEDEEDPKVIKELIDLIKKAGGIEQLEKQLLQDKNVDTTSGNENVTPATISRSLYERVLNRQASKIAHQRPVFSSSETSYVNGPGRAQFEGLDEIPEVKSLRQKPQYVTIERSRSPTKDNENIEEEEEEEEEEDDNTDVASSEKESVSHPEDDTSTHRVTPNYVNIRRTRPSATTSRTENDVVEKEAEEEKPTRRRRPFIPSKQQDNEASSETSKSSRNRGSSFRISEKGDNPEDADQAAEKDDSSQTTKSRYINIQRFRSTTLKTSDDSSSVGYLTEAISETTPPTRLEEAPNTIASTTSSTSPATTTSTSTEVITVISVEPPDNPSSVNPKDIISSTTDSVKLVEDSATEILLTTMPAAVRSSSPSSTTTTTTTTTTAATTTTLGSRSTIAAVSQPRPFGFTRRRSGSSETTTTTTTPSSRSKVADSKTIKLPTLKELIGHPTTYYDDRVIATPLSVISYLLRDEVDNDISLQNVEEAAKDEETGDSWLRQASKSKARSRIPKMADAALNKKALAVNAIQEDENNKRRKEPSTSIYLKPTTMRGIPLADLTPSPVIRGFYVTKSEDASTRSSVVDFTLQYTTDKPIEPQAESTSVSDISATEIATRAYNDQNESNTSDSDRNDDTATDEVTTIVHKNQNETELDILTSTVSNEESITRAGKITDSSTIPLEDSSSVETLRNYEKPNIAISNNGPASKRRKTSPEFAYNETPNTYVVSTTSPTRRKIALAVNRYNEATAPLWTGRRIVAKKRYRTTVSPIKDAIRRTESGFAHSTESTGRKFSAITTISSVPLSTFRVTVSPESLNTHRNLASSLDTKIDDSNDGAVTEAETTLTNLATETTPKIVSTAIPTAAVIPTISDDSKIITRTSTDVSSTSSTAAVAQTPSIGTDTTTTTFATTTPKVETTSTTWNYLSDISTTTSTHVTKSDFVTVNTENESNSTVASYLIDFTDTTSEVDTASSIANYSETTIPVNTNAIATDSSITTISMNTEETILTSANYLSRDTTVPATRNEVKTTSAVTKSFVTDIPATANMLNTITTDSSDTTTLAAASTEDKTTDDTIANYSTVITAAIADTHKSTTDSVVTSAITNADTETTFETTNYFESTIPTITNLRATPATATSPVTRVISSTAHPTVSMTPTSNFIDTVTDMMTTTVPSTSAIIIDPNVITTSANMNTSSTTTSAVIDTLITTQSRASFVTSSEFPMTNTLLTSSLPTPANTEPSILNISNNFEILNITEDFIQTTPIFSSTKSKFSSSTSSETSLAGTTAFPIQTDESFVTPIITQTPSALPSLVTPITDTTVTLEESKTTDFSTTSYESIATNTTIRTTANIYPPLSTQTTNENTMPKVKTNSPGEVASSQNEINDRTITIIYEPNSKRTINKGSTILEMKPSKEATSKDVQNQEEMTSGRNNTAYRSGQKTSRSRVVNRTNNWNGWTVPQRMNYQYPRRVTLYRTRSRGPSNISSARTREENLRRRIAQKRARVNPETISSTIRSDENIDVQNTTQESVMYDQVKNIRRRMKVTAKKVRERNDKDETTALPVQETTILLQSSISVENEPLQGYFDNENIERGRLLKKLKPQEDFVTEEIRTDSSYDSNIITNSTTAIDTNMTTTTTTVVTTINIATDGENHSNISENNFRIGENRFEQEKIRRRMRVVSKSVRPTSKEENSTEEASANSDSINKNLRGNFSNNSHKSRRERMRVVLKRIRLKEETSTIKTASAELDSINENSQENLLSNLNASGNFTDKEKVKRRMRIAKRVKSKSEEIETRTEKIEVNSTVSPRDIILNNLRDDTNFPIEYGRRNGRRMRVVLKSVRPKFEESNLARTEETRTDSDSTDKDLQGSFSNNPYVRESRPDEEEIKKEVVSKKTEPVGKDLITEETEDSPIIFVSVLPPGFRENKEEKAKERTNVLSKKVKPKLREDITTEENNITVNKNHESDDSSILFKSEKEQTTTGRQEDTESRTTEATILTGENTDRFSFETLRNNGSLSRKSGSGSTSVRQRKPTQPTTVPPLISTLPNYLTTHRRSRPIIETTLSPRIDLNAFDGTESYVKSAVVEDDQKTDVSDQSIRAQEYAVTLADPPISSSNTGRTPLRDVEGRKISTTVTPRMYPTTERTVTRYDADVRGRKRYRTKDSEPTVNATARPRRPPVIDYDYYEDEVPIVIGKSFLNSKLFLTSKGTIRCLDQGNFPHPYSCKKFITCARMVNGQVIGTEYTCPDKLSFDPIGGICNWSAGLGCKE